MSKRIIKPKNIIYIILLCLVLYFNILYHSFATLHNQGNEWIYYIQDNIDEQLEMRRKAESADYEAWPVSYEYLIVPYARVQATLVDNGKYSIDGVKTVVTKIAQDADKIFGGNRSIVTVDYTVYDNRSIFEVEIKKRCYSMFSFVPIRDKVIYEAMHLLREE